MSPISRWSHFDVIIGSYLFLFLIEKFQRYYNLSRVAFGRNYFCSRQITLRRHHVITVRQAEAKSAHFRRLTRNVPSLVLV